MAEYRVNNRIVSDEDPNFESMLESVYKTASRPLCMCSEPGIEMQIARINGQYFIKRMPNKGKDHSPQCGSFETPPELSGLGDLIGTAIQEKNGVTFLKFDFPLSHRPEKTSVKAPAEKDEEEEEEEKESVKSPSKRLSLRATLHYLWQEAGLTRWHPTIKQRTWADVYRLILLAVDNKQANESHMKDFLYLPEPCTSENKWDVVGRRCHRWAAFRSNHPKQLMLIIGEVAKDGINGYDYGGTISIDEIQDTHLLLSKEVHKSIVNHFAAELALWRLGTRNRLVVGATFSISSQGVGNIEQITFMPTTEEWIPFETSHERDLITRLLGKERSFEKILRYNFARDYPIANILLLDTMPTPTEMFVIRETKNKLEYKLGVDAAIEKSEKSTWRWDPMEDTMPEFPDSILGPAVAPRQDIRAVM